LLGGAGHIGIGINGRNETGFYSECGCLRGPGEVVSENLDRKHTKLTIPTTPNQDLRLGSYLLKKRLLNTPFYKIGGSNCSHFVLNALNHIGIDHGIGPYDRMWPKNTFDKLKGLE